ncbi:trypsin-like serine protease [Paracoccus haematequi]
MRTACRIFSVLAFIWSAWPALAQSSAPEEFDLEGFIGGGTIPYGNVAPDYSFPGVGRITFGGSNPGCTATLISDQVIITARHCIYVVGTTQLKRRISVTFRSTRRCGASGPHHARISRDTAYFHPKVVNNDDEGDRARDVALIKLPRAVDCPDERVVPVATTSDEGRYRTVSGWGLTLLTQSAAADRLYFVPPARLTLSDSTNFNLHLIDGLTLDGKRITNPVCNADSGAGVFRMINSSNLETLELIGIIQHYTVKLGAPPVPGPSRPATDRVAHCITYGQYAVAARTDALQSFIEAGLEYLQ